MTDDDILRMARKAAARHGHTLKEQPSPETVEFITELAAMAAAAEREACAKACENVADEYRGTTWWKKAEKICDNCADAIRARGNHDQG